MSSRPSLWPMQTKAQSSPSAAARPKGPNLRVLEGGSEPAKSRITPRVRLAGLIAMVAVVLFGVVAFHVVLSQGEFKLENLSAKADSQQDQYERLRLQVSQLESPSRITSEAQNRLGMVTPDKVTPVTPNSNDLAKGQTTTTSGSASQSTQDDPGNWAQVKSQLNSTSK